MLHWLCVLFVFDICIYSIWHICLLFRHDRGWISIQTCTRGRCNNTARVVTIATLSRPVLQCNRYPTYKHDSRNEKERLFCVGFLCFFVFILFSLPGDRPSAQFPVVSAKLWLRWRSAPPGTASHSSTGPTPQHEPTASCLPAIPRHHGSQPQHDAASHQQGTVVVSMCGSSGLSTPTTIAKTLLGS